MYESLRGDQARKERECVCVLSNGCGTGKQLTIEEELPFCPRSRHQYRNQIETSISRFLSFLPVVDFNRLSPYHLSISGPPLPHLEPPSPSDPVPSRFSTPSSSSLLVIPRRRSFAFISAPRESPPCCRVRHLPGAASAKSPQQNPPRKCQQSPRHIKKRRPYLLATRIRPAVAEAKVKSSHRERNTIP